MSIQQPSQYPFGLLQLFIEFIKCLKVLFAQFCYLRLMQLLLLFPSLPQLGNLCLTFGPKYKKKNLLANRISNHDAPNVLPVIMIHF